jgi:hypothetical protein
VQLRSTATGTLVPVLVLQLVDFRRQRIGAAEGKAEMTLWRHGVICVATVAGGMWCLRASALSRKYIIGSSLLVALLKREDDRWLQL